MRNKLMAILTLSILLSCVPNIAPAQTNPPSSTNDFLQRYQRLIDSKTNKEFKKLKSDSERQAFIDNFWKERDPDPATEANEFKEMYDNRISDVENDIFFSGPDLSRFSFRTNGGLGGDTAWVYLMFGKPSFKAELLDKNFVDDLMVWIYVDMKGGAYRFLFYRDRGFGYFKLFTSYYGYLPDRLNIISRFHVTSDPSMLEHVYEDIIYSPDGHLFLAALIEFSTYGTYPDQELKPPLPAALVAKSSGIRISGLPVDIDEAKYILSNRYYSMFRSSFRIGITQNKELLSHFILWTADSDWRIVKRGDKERAEAYYWLNITFIRKGDRKVFIYQGYVRTETSLEEAKKDQVFTVIISKISYSADPKLKNQISTLSELPSGEYKVNVYLRNEISKKYFSDIVEFKR